MVNVFKLLLYVLTLISVQERTETKTCNISSQCIGQHIETSTAHIYGYRSASGPTTKITSSNSIECSGSFSCNGASSIISNKTTCFGSNSCSNVNHFVSNYFMCWASNSCTHSTLIARGTNRFIQCTGHKSCAHSSLIGLKTIEASAAYALYNATIYSNGTDDTLNVILDGYHTALNATLICELNDICDIYCYSNACYQLYVDCVGSCNIYPNSADTIYPITNISDIIQIIELEYDPPQNTINNDIACNTATAYDDYQEHKNGNEISNAVVCCRGFQSCHGTKIVSSTQVLCSGSWSCRGTDIIHNGSIYCEGVNACLAWKKELYTTDSVYCLGREGCGWQITIRSARNIYCNSYWGCAAVTIVTAGSGDIYRIRFLAKSAGHNAVINCVENDECIVLCAARNACDYVIIQGLGRAIVYCDRDSLCPVGYTLNPTNNPTNVPTMNPSTFPTNDPSANPTNDPSSNPTNDPSSNPTNDPSSNPTNYPSSNPTNDPSSNPTNDPLLNPTYDPTNDPSANPTDVPTTASSTNTDALNLTTFQSVVHSITPSSTPLNHTSTTLLTDPTVNDGSSAEVIELRTTDDDEFKPHDVERKKVFPLETFILVLVLSMSFIIILVVFYRFGIQFICNYTYLQKHKESGQMVAVEDEEVNEVQDTADIVNAQLLALSTNKGNKSGVRDTANIVHAQQIALSFSKRSKGENIIKNNKEGEAYVMDDREGMEVTAEGSLNSARTRDKFIVVSDGTNDGSGINEKHETIAPFNTGNFIR